MSELDYRPTTPNPFFVGGDPGKKGRLYTLGTLAVAVAAWAWLGFRNHRAAREDRRIDQLPKAPGITQD